MFIPKVDELKGNLTNESYMKNFCPEFLEYLNKTYPEDLTLTEKVYWYYNNITTHPICKCCDKPTSFINKTKGYRTYCSVKCESNDIDKIKKTKHTLLVRYGNENYVNTQKYKQTCLEKYGVDNYAKTQESKDKSKQTCLERYDAECYFHTQEYKDKSKQTCLKKYGKEHYTNLGDEEVRRKIKETRIKTFLKNNPDVLSIKDNMITMKCNMDCEGCDDHTFEIPRSLFRVRKQWNYIMCTKLNKKNSGSCTHIEEFVKDILDKNNIEYECKNRSIISPKEIDIYIPSKKLAIECNGCFWHNSLHKIDKNYHVDKYNLCKEHGTQLLSLWEDQIKNKPQIIESIILSKLGIYKRRVYARNCYIKEIDNQMCKSFLDDNHLQGSINSSVCLGLFYNEELISIMSFGKNRIKSKNEKDIWELYRYCNLKHTQVIGGASKLFKYFIDKYNPLNIISFSSNDISNGSLYKNLGFEYIGCSQSYWYVHQTSFARYHRFAFTKKKIIETLCGDPNLTEEQNMFNIGFWRVYDSGQSKWLWKKLLK